MAIDMNTYLYIIGGIFGFCLCFVAGLLSNVLFRAWLMNAMNKGRYGVLYLCSKDKRQQNGIIVDLTKDILMVDGHTWIVDQGHIYRKDVKTKGFYTKQNFNMEEGVPTVYVDRDTMLPLSFYEEKSNIPPKEMYAFLKSWIDNERAKLLAQTAMLGNLVMLIMVLNLLLLGGVYMIYQQASKAYDGVEQLKWAHGMNSTYMPKDAKGNIIPLPVSGVYG